MKPLTNKLIAAVFVAIFATACSIPAQANEGKKEKKQQDTIFVELKFKGNRNNQPVFELVFSNPEISLYRVTIRDYNGMIWYQDKLKGSNFSRTYVLNTLELGNVPMEVEVTGKRTDKKVVYKVSWNSKTVESVAINKQQ